MSQIMQLVRLVIAMLITVIVYNWLTTTSWGSELPTLGSPAAAAPTAAVAPALATPQPVGATDIPTQSATATATTTSTPTPTVTRTPSPTVYVVQYQEIVRQVKSIAELNTKETIIDVVVTYDAQRDGLTALWDKGDFLSVKSTYRVKAGIDWKAVNVNVTTDNRVTVTFNPARITSIEELVESSEVNYYKKGIRAIFAEDNTVNGERLKQAKIDLQERARVRACEIGLVDDAASEAQSYVKSLVIQLNPLLNPANVNVVIGTDTQCS
jgi:hypothetical protein